MAETTVTDLTASATDIVDATPEEVFDFLRRPANHATISGDGSVKGNRSGSEVLGPGDRFNMSMKQGIGYRVTSKVVEFEENRRIAWCHIAKHRWRWELEPTDDGRTRVTETFDLAPSPLRAIIKATMGVPAAHEGNVKRSVENLRDHFA